jgi:pimeloyl-ACP methyl ester carboxylesterase
MARAKVGSVELEYEVRGEGVPLVLVMGIGAQMIFWDDEMVDRFVAQGFRVLRFDHRDIGLSTRLDHLPVPRPGRVLARSLLGLPVPAPYTLSDMASDVVGLMDVVGFDRAHVVGVSMGGMIAQHLAIEHPRRVQTMTSIMSTPGMRPIWPSLQPRPSALRALFAPRPRSADEAAAQVVTMFKLIGGVRGVIDDADASRLQEVGRKAYERGQSPRGFLRHFAAIAASGDRTARLRGVRTPSLVIHGAHDPLIRVAAGRATARAIPGARYLEIPDMAHFLPKSKWDQITRAIADHSRAALSRSAA